MALGFHELKRATGANGGDPLRISIRILSYDTYPLFTLLNVYTAECEAYSPKAEHI
jgi:hypothetical protein